MITGRHPDPTTAEPHQGALTPRRSSIAVCWGTNRRQDLDVGPAHAVRLGDTSGWCGHPVTHLWRQRPTVAAGTCADCSRLIMEAVFPLRDQPAPIPLPWPHDAPSLALMGRVLHGLRRIPTMNSGRHRRPQQPTR
ncbi:hypothetical protein CLV68_4494 [Actinokineospora cianjurensis]|uniref:Uncharacterized protein n=1 Tax=Actinokineospora cianjurensis TaxID=585224 RepID=A0A421B1X2_9PSEU|nr:hypothetical protein CLV68_4494 [Actinokineospora cianjurensis]